MSNSRSSTRPLRPNTSVSNPTPTKSTSASLKIAKAVTQVLTNPSPELPPSEIAELKNVMSQFQLQLSQQSSMLQSLVDTIAKFHTTQQQHIASTESQFTDLQQMFDKSQEQFAQMQRTMTLMDQQNNVTSQGTNASKYAPSLPAPQTEAPISYASVLKVPEPTIRKTTIRPRPTIQQVIRAFTPISPNQGFQYLYLRIRSKIPIGQMRSNLRKLQLNQGSIIDVMYPSYNVVGLLVHNDYVETVKTKLAENKLQVIKDYDPSAAEVINDPKLQSESIEVREQKAKELHSNRLVQSLKYIRTPVRYAVSKDFFNKGWITKDTHDFVMSSRSSDREPSHSLSDNFVRNTSDNNDSQQLNVDTEMTPPEDEVMLDHDSSSPVGVGEPSQQS